jgi:hypothetical protein
MTPSALRGLFGLTAAVSAAALTDPMLESASNAGWFGPGGFTDHSTLDVLPALAVAALLGLLYALLRAKPALSARSIALARRLQRDAAAGPARLVWRLSAATFGLQLGVLYAMETVEQIAIAGHPLGGTLWLGAPAAIALAAHGAACALSLRLLAFVLAALTRATVALVLFVRARAALPSGPESSRLAPRRERALAPRPHPLASRSSPRAPPLRFA